MSQEVSATKPKTVRFTLNGVMLEAPQGTTIMEAALSSGTFIPHYCYHVDLSIAGVCRMCVVEVEKNPKLQIACNTPITEGMVVHSENLKVKEAVRSALELHLINHPLDCPICDKAGECKLQDYYQQYGLYKSRMEFDAKNHKPKVVDIGTIVLDAERCILCSRCVRFTSEVTKTNELCIVNRGDRAELKTYNEKPLHNDYTGNLADICPVGALTAKDFRFQQRVWFLDKTETVCTSCSTGCNTVVSYNPSTKKLYRVEPRRNPEVNKSWMCDQGRWGYHFIGNSSRLRTPRKKVAGQWTDTSWEFAFKELKHVFSQEGAQTLVGLASWLTNEELLDVGELLKKYNVGKVVWLADQAAVSESRPFDGILKRRDQTSNAQGFLRLKSLLSFSVEPWEPVALADYQNIVLFGLEKDSLPWLTGFFQKLTSAQKLFVHATNMLEVFEKATWVLPNTSSYEKSGTVVNALGRLQRLKKAVPEQYISRNLHQVAFGIDRGDDRESVAESRSRDLFDSKIGSAFKVESTFKKMNALGIALSEATGGAHA